MKHPVSSLASFVLSSALSLSACGGGGGGGEPPPPPTANPGGIQFETTALTVDEVAGGSTATFNVSRTGGSDGDVSVTINRTGTATAGADYTIASTTVSFAAGDAATKTVRVIVADDTEVEADETLTMTLSAPTGGATVGANAATTLTIKDNDGGDNPPPPPPQGSIQFEATALTVAEVADGATATFSVTRTGSSDGAVSVTISQAGTATEGADYTLVSSTVSFAAGDTATKTVTVSVLDDSALELDETLTLTLSAPTVGTTIGTNTAATLTIKDTDVPPAPAMQEATSSVKQLMFSWLKAEGATSYRLLESPDGDSAFTPVEGVELGADASSVTLDIAVHGIDWPNAQYKVEACFQDRCSSSNAIGVANAMVNAIGRFTGTNTGPGDDLGFAVAISGDGKTLAVGTRSEDSELGGIGNCGEDSVPGKDSGAVYVFVRDGQAQWSEQACIKADNSHLRLAFGSSVALSGTGDVLAVGAPFEDSLAQNSGAAYVFVRDPQQVWSQQTMVKASNPGSDDEFGTSIALSGDGSTLAVGAKGEDSDLGDIDNDFVEDAGAVYVFHRIGKVWSPQPLLKAQLPTIEDFFGTSVALDATGSTLLVGAPGDDKNASGGFVPPIDNSGAVYVFVRDQTGDWDMQLPVLKADNAVNEDHFGHSVAMSADGTTAAVGAPDQNGDDALGGIAVETGAAYVFTRDGDAWQQRAFLLADKVDIGLGFGRAVALSEHGDFLAVGAAGEDLNVIDTDPEIPNSGAAYVFVKFEDDFFPLSRVKATDPQTAPAAGVGFGMSLGLSADGSTLAAGAPQQDTSSGAVFLY